MVEQWTNPSSNKKQEVKPNEKQSNRMVIHSEHPCDDAGCQRRNRRNEIEAQNCFDQRAHLHWNQPSHIVWIVGWVHRHVWKPEEERKVIHGGTKKWLANYWRIIVLATKGWLPITILLLQMVIILGLRSIKTFWHRLECLRQVVLRELGSITMSSQMNYPCRSANMYLRWNAKTFVRYILTRVISCSSSIQYFIQTSCSGKSHHRSLTKYTEASEGCASYSAKWSQGAIVQHRSVIAGMEGKD